MVEIQAPQIEDENMSDDEALRRITEAMKQNAPSQDDKNNMHTFLLNVVQAEDMDKVAKVGNLKDDKDLNELGNPIWTVRGALDMAMLSEKLMDNTFFKEFFQAQAKNTLITSLSRDGFLAKLAVTTTKNVADITRRRKTNKGMFGKKSEETSGESVTG